MIWTYDAAQEIIDCYSGEGLMYKHLTDTELVFRYPLSESDSELALAYITEHGAHNFLEHTNLTSMLPNVFPLREKQEKRLDSLEPKQMLEQINEWIIHSVLTWDNVSVNSIHNQQVNTAKLAYKGQQYGTQFLLGDIDALPNVAFAFPLLEDELYLALDVIEEKGVGFFVKHCASLPNTGYGRDTQEETIANMETLERQYGPYWLLGQLNAAAILEAKGYSVMDWDDEHPVRFVDLFE